MPVGTQRHDIVQVKYLKTPKTATPQSWLLKSQCTIHFSIQSACRYTMQCMYNMWKSWHCNQSFSKVSPLFICLSKMPVGSQRHDTWQIQHLKTVRLRFLKSQPAIHLSVRIACSADFGELLAVSKSLGWMPIAQTHSRWPASRCSLLVPLSTECRALLTRMYGSFDCLNPLL